jgi:predicted amidohydrolase
VAGVAMRSGKALHNGAIAIDRDGSIAGRAHKLFLWHFDRRWFEPGERVGPIQTAAGNLGILVCADGRIPTISRVLVDRGAEVLVMPTAWVTSGRDPHALENVQADLLARVRAYENGVPFVAANKCGAEMGMVAYCGKTQVIDADGRVVAIAGEREPETVKAVVETGAAHPFRATLAHPSPRATDFDAPMRVAITTAALPRDIDHRLEILDDAHVIAPNQPDRFSALDHAIPAANVTDEEVLDPAGLVGYRRAGYRLAIWTTNREESPWTVTLARARALELRMYVVVLDCRAMRAIAVDPDGTVVAGTFGDYRLASFSLDPRRTIETAVAPGTDIADGLERVAAIVRREDRAKV